MLRDKTKAGLLAGLVAANLLVLISDHGTARLVGGMLLIGIAGWILVALILDRSGQLALLARLVTASASGYVVVSLTVLGSSGLSVGISVWLLVAVLDAMILLLLGVSTLRGINMGASADREPAGTWVYVLVLLVVFCVFRFTGLGYAHFDNGDEIPILYRVQSIINGDQLSVLLEHRKPPAEIAVATAFVLLENGSNEFLLRFPFAFASVLSGLFLFLFGRTAFSPRVGFLSALLLALDGFYLSKSRWIQYQGLVVLSAIAAVYFFWRALSSSRDRSRFLVLGSVFFAFGCICHYEGVVVLPALAVLYLCGVRSPWRRELPAAAACVAIVLVMTVPFYFPFLLSSPLGETRSDYFGGRLGWGEGVYNNLNQFVSFMLFSNSIYYVSLMGLVLVVWLAKCQSRQLRSNPALVGSIVSFLIGSAIGIGAPGLLQTGNVNWNFVLFLPIVIVLVFQQGFLPAHRAIGLWFMGGFIYLGFFVRQPLSHWYLIIAPWTLIGGWVVDRFLSWLGRRLPTSRRWLVWVPVALSVILFGGFLYLFFLQRSPRYATALPEKSSPVYWTPLSEAPEDHGILLVGTPRQGGWKVIGHLYRTGALRGSSRTSCSKDNQEWYMGHKRDEDDSSRYVIYCGPDEKSLAPEAIERWYELAGRVLVGGQPRQLIYERKDTSAGGNPTDYVFEEYEPLYDDVVSLDEQLRFREVGADKKTFYREAGLVETMSESGDEIVFTEREQVGLFSYRYSGELSYHIPEKAMEPDDVDEWLSGWDGSGKAYIVYWAADEGGERAKWDDWLASTDGIKDKAWHGNVGLAVYSETEAVGLHLLEGSRLGDSIELLGYETRYGEENGAVELVLYWAMDEYVWKDFTVFTHLVDDEGNLVGQKDNPPGGGLMPTSAWRTDKVVHDEYEISVGVSDPGECWIEVGMYDAGSGERLPASGEGALPDGRIRLPLPVQLGQRNGDDRGTESLWMTAVG